MRALVCTKYAEPHVLAAKKVTNYFPVPSELRMRVYACGVNFPDILMIRGKYQITPEMPFFPGSGEVPEIGGSVTGFSVRDRIIAMSRVGGMREELVVAAECCLAMPREIDFGVAAVFSLAYGTGCHALLIVPDYSQVKLYWY